MVAALVTGVRPAEAVPARPLLLVGGTFGPVSYMDSAKAYFQAQGFTVFSMQLSGSPPGSADIKVSAQAVCNRIDAIRTQTGAAKVDAVGHSQGALALRYCIKFQGGIDDVETFLSLGGVNYGSSKARFCFSTACVQMRPGSAFLTELNSGDDTPGSLNYVHIFSYVANGGTAGEDITLKDGATNQAAQDLCPGRTVEHMDEYDSAIMRDLMLDALLRQPLTTTCP
jgi:triacylglycerol esterase/lipase EstA (alpha/beta hydrolase family)